jgi:two-component system response regulator (stage 0 sporulation protein A)
MEEILQDLDRLRQKIASYEAKEKVIYVGDHTESIPYRVAAKLKEVGIPANLNGYRYLRLAISKAYEDFSIIEMMTKRLYPEISKEYYTTPSRAERCMRNAIELAYAAKGSRPTVSEFIACVADELRMEDGKY